MNDRLRIASEQLAAMVPLAAEHGVRVDGQEVRGCQNDVLSRTALSLADALLAAAGEREDSMAVASLRARVRELENIITDGKAGNERLSGRINEERARAEAAEAKVARLERQLEPLTEGEAKEIADMTTGLNVSEAFFQATVNRADRIRARRSE